MGYLQTVMKKITMKNSTESQHYFRTDHLKEDLKARSIKGGAITLASQTVSSFLRIGSTAILARLLLPADFGLIAMVYALVAVIYTFKDAGLSM